MRLATILFPMILASNAYAADWYAGLEVNYANLSGTRIYDTDADFGRNLSEKLLVPSVFLGISTSEKSNVLIRYAHLDGIRTEAIDLATNPNSGSDIILPAFESYHIEEQIDELTFSYLIALIEAKGMKFSLGPTLSLYHSKAYVNSYNHPTASYSSDDISLGLETNLKLKISDPVGASIMYRYSNPPNRDIHLLAIGLNLKL